METTIETPGNDYKQPSFTQEKPTIPNLETTTYMLATWCSSLEMLAVLSLVRQVNRSAQRHRPRSYTWRNKCSDISLELPFNF